MTALHHLQVRRARRLPVPLPPKPKRPIGPPVICTFRDVSIRVRADIEKTGATWDEFLDAIAGYERMPPLHLVTTLVPGHDRPELAEEIKRRRRRIRKARSDAAMKALDEIKADWEARCEKWPVAGTILERLFGRAS